MLVLSRKMGEWILIGEDVRITLVRCSGKRVQLGIEAPRDVQIARGELVPIKGSREGDDSDKDE